MRFGVYVPNQHPCESDPEVMLGEQVEFVRCVRDLGWDSLWTGQHFLTEETSQLSTIVTLARLAGEAGDMEFGIGLLLLPLLNPAEAAEHIASLGVVTGGRLTVGVGIGYRDAEYDAFGVPKSEAGKRFTANVKVLRSLLSGVPTDVDLPWCRLRAATLSVRSPRVPELWIGANSDVAVRRAARLADAWLINPHAPLSTVMRQTQVFDEERARVGLPKPSQTPLFREVFCAPRSQDAHELAARYLGAKYQTYTAWGQADVLPDDDTFDAPFGQLAAGRFIIGDPEECLVTMRAWRDAVGVDHFVLRAHWAGMPFEDAKTSVRLLAQEVFPQLRDAAGAAPPQGTRPSEVATPI